MTQHPAPLRRVFDAAGEEWYVAPDGQCIVFGVHSEWLTQQLAATLLGGDDVKLRNYTIQLKSSGVTLNGVPIPWCSRRFLQEICGPIPEVL